MRRKEESVYRKPKWLVWLVWICGEIADWIGNARTRNSRPPFDVRFFNVKDERLLRRALRRSLWPFGVHAGLFRLPVVLRPPAPSPNDIFPNDAEENRKERADALWKKGAGTPRSLRAERKGYRQTLPFSDRGRNRESETKKLNGAKRR